ncbi:MAG: PspC domain-containing protein [Candidatus Aminicenantes bacterium]|jgi:phage shock protein C|nr:PspC domain-containing protein [Candidatus Aminicenantes bacterium]MDH5742622.1 PspC domain-containing protein [Candidatus Aminicenantes bacterium]
MAKQLFRSEKNKMIGGVCVGLAEYFDIDSSLVRLIFVALTLITAVFPMLIFYIVAWIVIPLPKVTMTPSEKDRKK